MTHLWEVDHPYYCTEGNFYKEGLADRFESWAAFTETLFYGGDHDRNLIFRWDWTSWRRHPDPSLRGDSPDELTLFFVLQRTAVLRSASILVADDDEPAVRAWLAGRARTLAAIWAPILVASPSVRGGAPLDIEGELGYGDERNDQ
jgi:hypothetical protein